MQAYPKSSEKCVYALAATSKRQVAPERLLQTHSTFIHKVDNGVHGCVELGLE